MISAGLLLADTTTRTTYELARLQSYTERWHYLLLAATCIAVVAFVGFMYRKDSVDLRPGLGILLAALRIAAFAGLLMFYLGLEKRTQRQVTNNSRVVVMVDTSLSMGLHDSDTSSVPATASRSEQVVSLLDQSNLIDKLRQVHDVVLARFDSEVNRIVSLPKLSLQDSPPSVQSSVDGATATKAETVDWKNALVPHGTETRIGQSLRQVINEDRSKPIAGIVLLSDGGQNAGADPSAVVELARAAQMPVYTVGLGSDRRPANVRVSDLVAPTRAYPGDSFVVTGYVQAEELSDRTVTVELLSKDAVSGNRHEEGKLEGTQRIALGGRGEVTPVKFQITPAAAGRRTFILRVKAPAEDTNVRDNQQEVDVEIIDRKTKVLLIASGPTREYTFLRNLLQRDKEMLVDVWLQSAGAGVSQDAHQILDDFPSTAPDLFEYDCIVAFDPDWRQLDSDQIDLLERWVADKSGGLIVVAGPVETDHWVADPKLARIRALYPVEFNRRLALLEDSRFGSTTPWPLDFTREGLEAEFLWLADSGPASQQIWSTFPGVYGYYAVRGAKPGATVFARYSDPDAISNGQKPVYVAGQFYGSGRVFYFGSGEMWRLRALREGYFEQLYTKLIRHVSQGRLLLGSSRGMLLVDRDRYLLGNTVVVRAQLSNAQFDPLELPRVLVEVLRPDSTLETVALGADPARKGMYVGQFTALEEGSYRLELPVPQSDNDVLTRRIQVRVPDLERENPQRNDALLSELARRTGGIYYVGTDAPLGGRGQPALADRLRDRTETVYLAGVPDRQFAENWMRSLLLVICGALSLEWLIRRLSKLS